MLIYYDPVTGVLLHTIRPTPEIPPAGTYIEVPDNTLVSPLPSFQVVNGVLTDADLDMAQQVAIETVNELTGKIRRKYITVIPGQDMLYKEKETQAMSYLAASPEPNTVTGWEVDYPSIAKEVGITADTPTNVATVIVQLADLWREIGAQIDQFRLSAIKDIEEAPDRTTILTAVSTFTAAMELF